MTMLEELSNKINEFLFEFGDINPNLDGVHYTSPDANELSYCAELLAKNQIPTRCCSEWSSGGYRPYSSKVGQDEHNYLVQTINNLINKK